MTSPCSQSQLGVFYACRTNVASGLNYQNPILFDLPATIDINRLRKAAYDALCAHPYLFGCIRLDDNSVPYVQSQDCRPIDETVKVSAVNTIDDVRNTFAGTMDIMSDKLYRCEIYTTSDGHNYFYLDIHHILADGFTMAILMREISRLYDGKTAAGEIISGDDIAEAEASQRADVNMMQEARNWYARNYADAAETDSLPLPSVHEVANDTTEFQYRHFELAVNHEQVNKIEKLYNTQESVIMQTAFALLLANYTAENRASYCTAFWGRTDRRTLNTATMMVHTLPVFIQSEAQSSIGDLLKQMQERLATTQKLQFYNYLDTVNDLGLNNQVMFVYQGSVLADKRSLSLEGRMIPYHDLRCLTPGWKLSAELFKTDNGYSLKLGYATADYSESFMQNFADSYSAIISQMVNAKCVSDIRPCSDNQITWLDERNPKKLMQPDYKHGLVARFKEQVAAHPDAICCVAGDKRLTYKQIDELSDTVNPEYTTACGKHVIGYTVPRNEQMVIVPLSVAKAGKTALPLDSSYPEERLEFMKGDAAQYDGNDAFVLLYTSGSTGTPKGVMLSEKNVLSFCECHIKKVGMDNHSRYASYASYGFDAYQQDMWATLISGGMLHILSDEVRFDLTAMHDYFDNEGITHAFLTTQVATQMVINYPEMKTLQVLGTGGEKLMSIETPKTYRLFNGYGPTESIAYVCSHFVDHTEPNIPIGVTNDTTRLYIVNRYMQRLPMGAAGELLVSGEQVSLGYLNQPERTQEAFIDWQGTRVYRTGDIVRYREDGNIEFVGRKDGQVKIRGFRIELKEVEAVIREFEGIKDATVQAFDAAGGGKFIAAYIVSDSQIDINALNKFIRDRKPPYMVPAVTMQIDAIPLNQNQKVNRKALPTPQPSINEEETTGAAPLNILEQELHNMVAEIVGNNNFGITTELAYLGLTSITSIRLATQIHKRFGITLNAKDLVKGSTLQDIENIILQQLMSGEAQQTVKQPAEFIGNAPLTYSQTGVYFDCVRNPLSTLYNIPMRLNLPVDIDTEKLQQAILKVVDAHPELRAHFLTTDSGIIQQLDLQQKPEITVQEMTEEQLQQFQQEFVRPFNLSKDILCRFAIVKLPESVSLLCDMHHLVADGASYDIFINELCTLLDGKLEQLQPEEYSYMQFAVDQQKASASEEFASAKEFFHSQLCDIESATILPADVAESDTQPELCRVMAPFDLKAATLFAQQTSKTTVAPVTLAAVFYTLSRFASSDQICITTISNGRSDLRIANTMGMFVNTLALSSKITNQSVTGFVKTTSQNFEQTLQHENYPFAQIAADYGLTAEIMFAYQIGVISQYSCLGKPVSVEDLELKVPKFSIAFYIAEVNGQAAIVIEYDKSKYSQSLMQQLAQSVSNVITAFTQHPDDSLMSISLLDKQQTALLDSFNQTEVEYDDTQTIVSLFRRQAQLTPDNIAVVYHDKQYTYHEVDQLSDNIASHISGRVVSILIERSEWMVIASLAAMKAGCVYQPLDPSYPSERLNFMMHDAESSLLIADPELTDKVHEYNGPVLLTDQLTSLKGDKLPQVDIKPESPFIYLYTSGSTGIPKGCILDNGNIVAFCHWYQRYYELKAGDKVAAYASYGFDACMMDMYPALTCGATVYIIGNDIRLNLPDLNDYFNREGITHSFMTTQVGYQFATNCDNHSLRHLSVGGEKLLALTPPAGYTMHNGYGPTECTIFTTTYALSGYRADIPIGKPLDNIRLYIVDAQGNRLPAGALGELWVSGRQVGKGYLNRPEKTAESFIKNPFTSEPHYQIIYRTGDIVRYLPDGNLQFVGRQDGQVKIRGFRIELKEVEAVIREFEGIKDATVQAFDQTGGGKFIAAYIVSDSQIDINALNNFIRDRKPPYMVPAVTMQIDTIPLNQNQKVNRKALPAPELKTDMSHYVEPKNNTERLFCSIFASILQLNKIGAADNFFELGGTSLMVTRVIIEANKAGYHIAYGDVFDHPTPQQLAAFVSGTDESDTEPDTDVSNFDYSDINSILQNNRLDTFLQGERQSLGNVLLTGATGYLGIHILRELIEQQVPNIVCLIRGKDLQDSERRLRNLLFYYFDKRFDTLFGKTIHVINGDVTSDFEGLMASITFPVNTVFNCAANVKHFSKSTDIEDVNIGGAKRCVDYCLKTGARLIHVSTTSTGGVWIETPDGTPAPILNERNIWFSQYLGNQYMHSKFLADRLILDAVAHNRLNAKIMRVGNLAARSYDGEFQANFASNSYMARIKVFNMLGCCPYDNYDTPTEFSPIDETAKAIVLLATTPQQCTVFQPYNNHTHLLGDVLRELGAVSNGVKFVENEQFMQAMAQAQQDPVKAPLLTGMLAYQDIAHGKKASVVERENSYTCAVLHRLGFYWTDTSHTYLNRMINAIAALGFFDNK